MGEKCCLLLQQYGARYQLLNVFANILSNENIVYVSTKVFIDIMKIIPLAKWFLYLNISIHYWYMIQITKVRIISYT